MKTETLAFLAAASTASLVLLAGAGMVSCGVRGQPQPPLTPPELGRGEPGFKRASSEFAFPNVPSPTPAVLKKSREETR